MRKYGVNNNVVTIDAGRKCSSGEGFFQFQTKPEEDKAIFQVLLLRLDVQVKGTFFVPISTNVLTSRHVTKIVLRMCSLSGGSWKFNDKHTHCTCACNYRDVNRIAETRTLKYTVYLESNFCLFIYTKCMQTFIDKKDGQFRLQIITNISKQF